MIRQKKTQSFYFLSFPAAHHLLIDTFNSNQISSHKMSFPQKFSNDLVQLFSIWDANWALTTYDVNVWRLVTFHCCVMSWCSILSRVDQPLPLLRWETTTGWFTLTSQAGDVYPYDCQLNQWVECRQSAQFFSYLFTSQDETKLKWAAASKY